MARSSRGRARRVQDLDPRAGVLRALVEMAVDADVAVHGCVAPGEENGGMAGQREAVRSSTRLGRARPPKRSLAYRAAQTVPAGSRPRAGGRAARRSGVASRRSPGPSGHSAGKARRCAGGVAGTTSLFARPAGSRVVPRTAAGPYTRRAPRGARGLAQGPVRRERSKVAGAAGRAAAGPGEGGELSHRPGARPGRSRPRGW
jgi:hypothetical protein